jgi:methionyl-tRNA formyltransferase
MRVIFMGTPDFAVPTLAAVRDAGHEVAAVYTQPPRPAGRGMSERKSPVHAFAEGAGLPVLTPRSLKAEPEQSAFSSHGADVAVVVAYGLILPVAVLKAPAHGCFNLHASDLPRWRGAAPFQRAFMAGDSQTAACVMRMEEGLDTGPVCLRDPCPIGPDTTAGELHDALAHRGAALMVNALDLVARGALACMPQGATGVSYAAKVDKGETRVDFMRTAQQVHDHVRALSPAPGAWFTAREGGERVRLLRTRVVPAAGQQAQQQVRQQAGQSARPTPGLVLNSEGIVACGDGTVQMLEVQRAGKRPMPFADFARGNPLERGTQLQPPH